MKRVYITFAIFTIISAFTLEAVSQKRQKSADRPSISSNTTQSRSRAFGDGVEHNNRKSFSGGVRVGIAADPQDPSGNTFRSSVAKSSTRTVGNIQAPANGNRRPTPVHDGTSNTMMNVRVAAGDVNNDGITNGVRTEGVSRDRSITVGGTRTESRSNILSGTPTANGTFSRRANAVTFEGNDEPLWAKARQNSSGTAQNVGPNIHGNVRPKGFANTTFDDQAARSANNGSTQQLVQGNQIGVNTRPRRTGVTGDFDGDSDVDGADYLLDPSQKQKRLAGGTRSLSAGTYARVNR